MTPEEAVQEYQCPGCVGGPYPECLETDDTGIQCNKHHPGTTIYPGIGTIFLGMPKGFNRIGEYKTLKLLIFDSFKNSTFGLYDKFNVPVWKYLDKFGNTLIRGISPRLNMPFIHIFLEDCTDKFECIEINDRYLSEMD